MKLKIIAVTQREAKIEKYDESRDSLDRAWLGFFKECNITPLLLPNEISLVKKIFSEIKIEGILLTGGGDLRSCGGKDRKREEVEEFLIKKSMTKKIPLFAVCRGMQKVQERFGIKQIKVKGHISHKQKIHIDNNSQEVNSFHNFGTKENDEKKFEVFATSKDGVIKGIKHKKYPITAIMWHPERITPYRKEDIKLFNGVFK